MSARVLIAIGIVAVLLVAFDALEGRALVARAPLHRLDQGRNQVVAPPQTVSLYTRRVIWI
jgi:hypothetical protein